jgi:hypothetical protein
MRIACVTWNGASAIKLERSGAPPCGLRGGAAGEKHEPVPVHPSCGRGECPQRLFEFAHLGLLVFASHVTPNLSRRAASPA